MSCTTLRTCRVSTSTVAIHVSSLSNLASARFKLRLSSVESLVSPVSRSLRCGTVGKRGKALCGMMTKCSCSSCSSRLRLCAVALASTGALALASTGALALTFTGALALTFTGACCRCEVRAREGPQDFSGYRPHSCGVWKRSHRSTGMPDNFVKSLIHVEQHTYPCSSSCWSALVNQKETDISSPQPGQRKM